MSEIFGFYYPDPENLLASFSPVIGPAPGSRIDENDGRIGTLMPDGRTIFAYENCNPFDIWELLFTELTYEEWWIEWKAFKALASGKEFVFLDPISGLQFRAQFAADGFRRSIDIPRELDGLTMRVRIHILGVFNPTE